MLSAHISQKLAYLLDCYIRLLKVLVAISAQSMGKFEKITTYFVKPFGEKKIANFPRASEFTKITMPSTLLDIYVVGQAKGIN